MATTFVLTMTIALPYAVVGGVAISVVLFLANHSAKVTVTQLVFEADAPGREAPP